MHQAAKDAHLPSERMSFTATVMLCQTYASSFLDARTQAQRHTHYQEFVTHMAKTKSPARKQTRSYPRVLKFPRDKYPKRGIVKVYDRKDGR